MTTIAMAWHAFFTAIEEAKELNASGAGSAAVADLLQHARELLDIVDDEIATSRLDLSEEVRIGLKQLRARLAAVEVSLVTKHREETPSGPGRATAWRRTAEQYR